MTTHPYERRIFGALGLVGITLIPILVVAFLSVQKIFDGQRELIAHNTVQLARTQQLRQLNASLSSIMPAYVLKGDPHLLAELDEQYKHFDQLARQLEHDATHSVDRATLGRVIADARRIRELSAPGIAMRQKGRSIKTVNAYLERETAGLTRGVQEELKTLVDREMHEFERAKTRLDHAVEWVVGALIGGFLLVVALLYLSLRQVFQAMRQKRAADEAERRAFEREQQLSQARKEAVEVVAHDLKNPLSTLRMTFDLLRESAATSDWEPELRRSVDIGYRAAVSMQKLIQDLLDHAKIEAGQMVLDRAPVCLCSLVRELAARFEPLARARNLNLRLDVAEDEIFVDGDSVRLEQVLNNFIGNAIKFTPDGGDIQVQIAAISPDEVRVSVADSGDGLSPDYLPHVFDRFWQVRATAKQGTGLGLAIAKAVIEAHGGRIWAESDPGHGARFYFQLKRFYPRALSQPRPVPEASV